jgi:hypothetical protein
MTMKISRILCGNGELDATEARSPNPARRQTRERILLGIQTPENTFVHVQDMQPATADEQTPPLTIKGLWAYILDRNNKIPSLFRTKTRSRTPVGSNNTDIEMQSINSTQMVRNNEVPRPRTSMNRLAPLGTASREDNRTVLLAEENTARKEENRSDGNRSSETVANAMPGSEPALQPDTGQIQSSLRVSNESLRSAPSVQSPQDNGQNFVPSTFHDLSQISWIGAADVRAPRGESKALTIFYDSGSTDNMITKKLAEACGFELRLILPDDLRIYEGANSKFIPKYYVELELRDEGRGIKEYSRASFYVADTLGCWELLAGSTFMYRHNLGLASLRHTQSLVLTAKSASKGTCNRFDESVDY